MAGKYKEVKAYDIKYATDTVAHGKVECPGCGETLLAYFEDCSIIPVTTCNNCKTRMRITRDNDNNKN